MTLDEKKNRALVVTLIGAISFGIWQGGFFSGLFIACPLLLLGGLVVAVEDYLGDILVVLRRK